MNVLISKFRTKERRHEDTNNKNNIGNKLQNEPTLTLPMITVLVGFWLHISRENTEREEITY